MTTREIIDRVDRIMHNLRLYENSDSLSSRSFAFDAAKTELVVLLNLLKSRPVK